MTWEISAPLWFTNLLAWSVQAALLVAVAALLRGAFRLRQPRVLLGYWTALLAACLLLPALQPWRMLPQPSPGAAVTLRTGTTAMPSARLAHALVATAAQASKHWPFTLYQAVALTLLAGIVVRLTSFGLGILRLRGFRRHSRPLAPLPEVVKDIQARTRTPASFSISSVIDSPVTFGLVHPVILLPPRFPDLETRRQAAIACHELVHVRRHDWARHLAEEFLRASLWFHPGIVWLIGRIRLAREQVVDAEVLELTGARRPYLEALLEIAAGRNLARAVPAPLFLSERQLAERVSLMLKEVPMSRTRLIASLTAMVSGLALAGALAVWSFPLKAAARQAALSGATQSRQAGPGGNEVRACNTSDPGCPQDGVSGGVVGGVVGGVKSGVVAGVPGAVAHGIRGDAGVGGVPGGVAGGAVTGVLGGVPGGVAAEIKGGVIASAPGGVVKGVVGGVAGGVPGARRVNAGSDDASAPKLEHAVPPEYPPLAKMARIQGDVVLEVTIDEEGKVTNLEVVSGHPLLVKAALDAVHQWRYAKPAVAPMHFEVTVHFELPRFEHLEISKPETNKSAKPETSGGSSPRDLTFTQSGLKPIKTVNPVYPPEAKKRHIQGNVVLSVTVEKSGKVSNIEVLSGPEELVKSALYAVKQWEYESPARAPVVTTVTVDFTLVEDSEPKATPQAEARPLFEGGKESNKFAVRVRVLPREPLGGLAPAYEP